MHSKQGMESSIPHLFHLSRTIGIDRTVAWFLLLTGIALIISGFVRSLDDSTLFGVMLLLLGFAPALAGGYHAYSLEAGKYESRLQPTVLRRHCFILYLFSVLLGSIVYSVLQNYVY